MLSVGGIHKCCEIGCFQTRSRDVADVTHWNTNGSTSAKWPDLEHWSQGIGTITDSWGICSTSVWIYVGIPEW